ncbi:MAG: lipopolysaccharide kinase InaA family protein [Pseudomonadota bacterium]
MPNPLHLANLSSDRAPDGTLFYWTNDEARDHTLILSQRDFANPSVSDASDLLKAARQRFIYRHHGHKGSRIVKLIPLNPLNGLLPRKYAFAEFQNTQMAQALGLEVPATCAYLEKRRWFAGTSCVGTVFEDLEGYRELSKLLRRKTLSIAECGDIAAQALTDLYNAGANHLDARDANIMVHPDTRATSIIDWQHATYMAPRAAWLLEHLAGFYIQRSPEHRDAYLDSGLLHQLHARSAHPAPYHTFSARVLKLASRKRPLSERTKLLPVPV